VLHRRNGSSGRRASTTPESPARTGRGATLPDEKAYELFENTCKQDYARAFKLYKLYTRAASFTRQG